MGRLDKDNRVVADYLRGNRTAIREIEQLIDRAFIPFQRRLRAYFDDISQEVHITLLREFRKDGFQIHTSLRAYVGEITARRSLQVLAGRDFRDDENLGELIDRWFSEIVEEHQLDPKGQHDRRRLNRKLMLVAQMASDTCRLIFRMLFEGYSYEDIANELKISVAAVKSRIHDCRNRARANFAALPL